MATDSGTYTDDTIQRRRRIAEAMLGDPKKPITHWAEGLSEIAKGAIGGYQYSKADDDERAKEARGRADLYTMAGLPAPAEASQASGGGFQKLAALMMPEGAAPPEAAPAAPQMPPAAPMVAQPAPMPVQPRPMGNKVAAALSSPMVSGPPTDATAPMPMARPEVMPSAKVWGDKEAEDAGLYEKPASNTRIASAMATPALPAAQPAPAPVATPETAGGIFSGVPRDKLPSLVAGLNSKNPVVKALATQQIGNYTKSEGPTDETKEYKLAQGQGYKGSFMDFKTELKKAGATSVTTNVGKDEEAFDKEAGKIVANRFNDLAAEGPAAKQMMSDIQTLQQLGSKIGTGKTAEFERSIGPYAQAFGIKMDKLSDAEAYEAILQRVAPSLRVKGSGAQSDMELNNFLKSLPSIGKTPEGNALISKTMEGLYSNKLRAAEIGSQALNKEITRKEAEKRLRELPDPMQEWRDSQKAAKPATSKEAAPAAVNEGSTATNPKTGQTIIFKGGKWVPMT